MPLACVNSDQSSATIELDYICNSMFCLADLLCSECLDHFTYYLQQHNELCSSWFKHQLRHCLLARRFLSELP